jgi:hypothetical protein
MANQILANPFPAGKSADYSTLLVEGSIALAGSAVATGEPLNWTNIMSGVGYNEVNYLGNGVAGNGTAQTTGFAVSAGTCTCTAANNFQVGQQVTFLGNTQTLSALFNGEVVTVVSATSSSFTFTTAHTGTTTTGDVGLAVIYAPYQVPEPSNNSVQNLTVSALSASGTTLTVTAANNLLPGAYVNIVVASGTLGPKLAGLQLPVIKSTTTAFTATMPSALTGTTGTGTGTGINPAVPYSVKVWSELNSGYVYQYNSTTGCLFVMAQTSGASAGDPLAKLAAAAYPAGVLNDLIKYEARFVRG